MDDKELKRFLSNMTEHINELQDDGDLTVGTMHNDDSTFIIMEGWQPVYKLNTYLAIEAGVYDLYQNAIANADKFDKHGQADFTLIPGPIPELFPDVQLDNIRQFFLIDDLRLGRSDLYPSFDDKSSPYLIPSPLDEYVEAFWDVYGEFGFSDEYNFCGACGKIIKTSPDSYCWQPDFIELDGELFHVDCVDLDDVLESHKNAAKAIPPELQQRAMDQGLLIELKDIEYQNGMHPGMNDDPAIIIKRFKQAKIDIWFNVEPSQFYVDFTVLVHPDNEAAAREILSNLNVYQGYDTAEEMSKALQGKHSDYIHVETKMISSEDFVNGNL